MNASRNELIKIKDVLKANPKGLSLSDISRLVSMNRHSIAKYMEMLTISGQVEMRFLGPSKVYYLSQRVPISAMLGFSSDMICTLDRDMKVIQVNDAFLTFFGQSRENLAGQNIRELDDVFPMNNGMISCLTADSRPLNYWKTLLIHIRKNKLWYYSEIGHREGKTIWQHMN
jgi:PAS domain-containing protein